MTTASRRWARVVFFTLILAVWIWVGRAVSRRGLVQLLGWTSVLTVVGALGHHFLRRTALGEDALELLDRLWFGAILGVLPTLMAR